ncbi:MAG: 2Fe-2S iron-sulfur cluster-binding protein, partial [bacterium]
ILQAAQENGIDIPTLCNHAALLPFGGCRMCVVQAGPGALKPACATPIAPNMEVVTDSSQIGEARMMILQLLFGERNHYCMFCESTGQCELQDLGYKLGLDHFEFFPYERRFPEDVTHPTILVDQNRCILCRRCVRACADVGGHWVLGVKNRGYESLIDIDMDAPFNDSSCTSCGLCVQVCPTGALVDKRASYLGRKDQAEMVLSRCDRCPVGCGLEVYRRSNYILKIYGDWNCPTNAGVTCRLGRYAPLYDERPRLSTPKLKETGVWTPASAEKTARWMAEHLDAELPAGGCQVAGGCLAVVEGSLSNEDLAALKSLFGERVFSLQDVASPLPATAKLQDLADADTYLVVGVDLNKEFGTVGSLIKRRTIPGAAKLIVVDDGFNSLAASTDFVFSMKDLDSALAEARKGQKVVIVYSHLREIVAEALRAESQFLTLFLPYESNTLGLAQAGIGPLAARGSAGVVFFVGENLRDLKSLTGLAAASYQAAGGCQGSIFSGATLVALTPFETDEVKAADLIVPIPAVFESEGSFISMDGELLRKERILEPGEGVRSVSAWVSLVEAQRLQSVVAKGKQGGSQ